MPSQRTKNGKGTEPKENPLCEVAGLPAAVDREDTVEMLKASAAGTLPACPYKFLVDEVQPRCSKSSRTDPIPVCSIHEHRDKNSPIAITCPYRFLQGEAIFARMERDLLPEPPSGGRRAWVPEVVLPTAGDGEDLGRIDYVGVTLDSGNKVLAALTVELQAVYTSGSSGKAFRRLREAAVAGQPVSWRGMGSDYPTTDFLSSWKRVRYQVLEKGAGIIGMNAPFSIRQALVVDKWFYDSVLSKVQAGELPRVEPDASEFVVYSCELTPDAAGVRILSIVEPPLFTTHEHLRTLIGVTPPADLEGFLKNIQTALAGRKQREVASVQPAK